MGAVRPRKNHHRCGEGRLWSGPARRLGGRPARRDQRSERDDHENNVGLYSFPNLPLGTYAVTFTLQGFSPLRREAITVGLAETITLDTTLDVGGLQDTVTVTSDDRSCPRRPPRSARR